MKKMKKNGLLALLLIIGSISYAQFTTTWNVVADDNGKFEVTIPINKSNLYTYNYDVDWDNNGVFDDLGVSTNITHDYGSSGTHTIAIRPNATSGSFPGIFFKDAVDNDREELTGVTSWGGNSWQTFAFAFAGCSNLTSIPSTAPDLTGVTDLSYMFLGATSFNDADINNWNVDSITNMRGLFMGASSFNQDLSNWNSSTGSVTDMSSLFSGASSFSQDLYWNTAAVTDMSSMFSGASAFNFNFRLNGGWKTDLVTDMSHMFEGAYAFDQYIGYWNIGNVTDMGHMLSGSGLSSCTYQSILNGWLASAPSNMNLGADGLYYYSTTERSTLTSTKSWIIEGDNQTANNECADTSWFVTNWTVPGSGEITIPTFPTYVTSGDYLYDVDWDNDGVFDSIGVTGDITHSYTAGAKVTINIRGSFPSIYFNNTAASKDALTEVVQWGTIEWLTFRDAFWGCSNLEILGSVAPPDLSHLIVYGLQNMFREATSFKGPIGHWDVTNVTNMSGMFQDATSFVDGGIGDTTGWERTISGNTSTVGNVTDMQFMFKGASSFNGDISNWNTGSNTSLFRTFNHATSFDQDISGWDVSQVTNMQETFALANSFNQNISAWDVSNVTTMYGMFAQNTAFNNASGDSLNWERNSSHPDGESTLANVTNMAFMFRLATAFDREINNWDVSGVTQMTNMFQATVFDQELLDWNVSSVVDMSKMFYQANFSKDISNWDVTSVENMSYMFADADQFNIDISDWNVSSVTDMSNMFAGAGLYNQPLNDWETGGSTLGNVTDMSYMFNGATAFNQDLDAWDVSGVLDMSGMFGGATLFNGDITSWDVGNVTDMSGMFKIAVVFNRDISVWDVTEVTTMFEMFNGASLFNQPIGNWERTTSGNTSSLANVTTMEKMFLVASNFNQNIGNWDISSITTMDRMLDNCGMLKAKYDNALSGWVATAGSGITLGALNLNFCAAHLTGNNTDPTNSDTQLESLNSWTINGDNFDCTALLVGSTSNNPLNSALSNGNSNTTIKGGTTTSSVNQFTVNAASNGVLRFVPVNSGLGNGTVNLSLYTTNGKLVYQGTQSISSGIVNCGRLSKGIYLLRINSGTTLETQKVVVQ